MLVSICAVLRSSCRFMSRRTFRLVVVLAAGLNAIVVSAQDLKPVSATLASQISSSGHKTVAVVDFTDLEGNVTKLGRYLSEELSVSLVENAKNFDVIDRTHLNDILQEHRLSATGLINPQTARKLGQLVGADAIITGTITPFGDTVRMSIKAIDPGTAKMVAAATTDIPKTPAILALLGEPAASVQPTVGRENGASAPVKQKPNRPSDVTSSSPDVAPNASDIATQANGFVFVLQSCQSSYGNLSCKGSVTNKEKRRLLDLNAGTEGISEVVDSNHTQYRFAAPERHTLVFGTSGRRQELENDLPIGFTISVRDFSATAKSVSLVFSCWTSQPYGFFKATMRNVPVVQN